MKSKFNFRLGAICLILSVMLAAPAWGQAKGEPGAHFKEFRAHMIKALKLSPDKEQALLAVDAKYLDQRKEIIAGLRKSNDELKTALPAPNPDEKKITDLVSSITAGQDKLFTSFKAQRDEELALMTPVEQGRYLEAVAAWHKKMMEKRGKKAPGEKK